MLLSNMELIATAPGGVAKLRELILALAVQGKLVPQDPADEPSGVLLQKIRAEKDRLMAEGKIKRDKPLAEIREEDKPFELPQGWEWVRLGSLLSFRIGKTPPSKDPQYWADAGHAWVSISDMNHFGEVRETGRKITDKGASVFGYEPLPPGTLIMSFKLTIGKISLLRVPAYHNEAIVSFTPLNGLDSAFLKYMLPTVAKTGASKDALMGATLNTESLSNLVIALPPQSEQSRIVTRVEALMRLCDALEAKGQLEAAQHAQLVSTLLGTLTASTTPDELAANWQRVAQHFDLLLDRPEAIDALEQTLLQLAVRGFLATQLPADGPVNIGARSRSPFQIPLSWSYVRFDDVLTDLRYGTSVKCGYDITGTPVIRIPNIRLGRIDTGDLKFGVLDDREQEKLRLECGDLLIVRSNGSASLVGSAALVDVDSEGFAFAGYLVRVRLNRHYIEPEYMTLVMQTLDIRRQIEEPIRTTSGVKNINSTEISGLSFALPPLAEQSRIVTRVTALRRLCADLRLRLADRQSVQARLAEALVQEVA